MVERPFSGEQSLDDLFHADFAVPGRVLVLGVVAVSQD
jgi:hypothetical protein